MSIHNAQTKGIQHKSVVTRMHSSRMRTVRCSGRWGEGGPVSQHALGKGAYPSMHWAGGCLPGGVCQGVSAQGRCLHQCMLGYTPPCEENDSALVCALWIYTLIFNVEVTGNSCTSKCQSRVFGRDTYWQICTFAYVKLNFFWQWSFNFFELIKINVDNLCLQR